jgi:hypothetical protein
MSPWFILLAKMDIQAGLSMAFSVGATMVAPDIKINQGRIGFCLLPLTRIQAVRKSYSIGMLGLLDTSQRIGRKKPHDLPPIHKTMNWREIARINACAKASFCNRQDLLSGGRSVPILPVLLS